MQSHFYDTREAIHPDKLVRRDAQQTWNIGQLVNVGFVRDLLVEAYDGAEYLLRSASGQLYRSRPHRGLVRVEA